MFKPSFLRLSNILAYIDIERLAWLLRFLWAADIFTLFYSYTTFRHAYDWANCVDIVYFFIMLDLFAILMSTMPDLLTFINTSIILTLIAILCTRCIELLLKKCYDYFKCRT